MGGRIILVQPEFECKLRIDGLIFLNIIDKDESRLQ